MVNFLERTINICLLINEKFFKFSRNLLLKGSKLALVDILFGFLGSMTLLDVFSIASSPLWQTYFLIELIGTVSFIIFGFTGGLALGPIVRKWLFPSFHKRDQIHQERQKIEEVEINGKEYTIHEIVLRTEKGLPKDYDISSLHSRVRKIIELGGDVARDLSMFDIDTMLTITQQFENDSTRFEICIQLLLLLKKEKYKQTDLDNKFGNIVEQFRYDRYRYNPLVAASLILKLGANPSEETKRTLTELIEDPIWEKILTEHYQILLALKKPRTLKDLAAIALHKKLEKNQDLLPKVSDQLPNELLEYYQAIIQRENEKHKFQIKSTPAISDFIAFYETRLCIK